MSTLNQSRFILTTNLSTTKKIKYLNIETIYNFCTAKKFAIV